LAFGQIYLPLALAGAAVWLLLERGRCAAAGGVLGLIVAVKPNFVLWPALLFLAGYHRVGLIAGVVAGTLSALPLLWYGPGVYVQWLSALGRRGAEPALVDAASALGVPVLGVVIAVLLVAVTGWWLWRSHPKAAVVNAIAVPLCLLALPYTNIGYLLLLLPVFFTRPWGIGLLVAGVSMMVPYTAHYSPVVAALHPIVAALAPRLDILTSLCVLSAVASSAIRAAGLPIARLSVAKPVERSR
jgi:hypothetical protein